MKNNTEKLSKSERAIKRRVFYNVIQKKHKFFIVVQPGFEEFLLNEIKRYNIDVIKVEKGGITFKGNIEDCILINNISRIATRVIMRLTKFYALHFNQIYRTLKNFPWELYINANEECLIEVTCKKSKLHHTFRIAQEVKNAIIKRLEYFNFNCKDENKQKQIIFVRAENDVFTVSLDSSGDPLYKRGYKRYVNDAPLRENIASALLLNADIKKYDVFVDPMCGSGTFTLEAVGINSGRYPYEFRTYQYMQWPSFRKYMLDSVNLILKQDRTSIKGNTQYIMSDINIECLKIAEENMKIYKNENVKIFQNDFLTKRINVDSGKKVLCAINPPYGKRIESNIDFYRKLFHIIHDWYDWDYIIILPKAIKNMISIKSTKVIDFKHGGIDVSAVYYLKNK